MDVCDLCTEAVEKPKTSLILRESVRILVEVAVGRSRPSGSGKYNRKENQAVEEEKEKEIQIRERLIEKEENSPNVQANNIHPTLSIWLGIQFRQRYGHIAQRKQKKL